MDNSNGKWDNRYLNVAKEVASWSKDPSRKIGAVIIGDMGQIMSQGYNAFPRNIKDYDHRYYDRETKYKFTVHAEMNAVYNAIHSNSSPVGATIYVTGLPVCHECAKAIIQVGISKVVMDTKPQDNWKESGELALLMFTEAGVEFEFVGDEYGNKE